MTLDRRTRWLALIVLCLGDLMIVLDTTGIGERGAALIRADLGFSQTSLAWVVNAYLLTFGGFLLLGGRLGDLFGHRRLFLIGISLFTVASIACGLSTQGLLVAARAVQGLGGAIVSAVALSLMMNLFTEPAERAKAMDVFGFVMAGGGSLGVLLGGVLTDTLSWHWIFLVNVPIGVAVYALSLKLVPEAGATKATGRIDIAGAVTVTFRADARGLRHRQGQRRRLGHRSHDRPAHRCRSPAGDLRRHRGAGQLTARPAPPLQAPERRDRERGRHLLGRRDVRLVLPVGSLPAVRARVQPAPGRSCLPAFEPDHGRLLARPLREARDALRPEARLWLQGSRWPLSGSCSSHGRRSTGSSSPTCFRA